MSFHSDVWFALAWGAFPVLTAYFAQTATLRVEAVLAAAACAAALRRAARALDAGAHGSVEAVREVGGEIVFADGSAEPLDASSLRSAPEGALRWLSLALPLLAASLLVARLG